MHPKKENIDSQLSTNCYSSLLAPLVVEGLIETSKFKKDKKKVIEEFFDDTKVDIMDNCDISRKKYTHVFKAIKSKVKDKRIRRSLLPLPTHMRK